MKFHEWGMEVDPDESCWVESVKWNVSFLVVIRVFFELGFSACEEIGPFSRVVSLIRFRQFYYDVDDYHKQTLGRFPFSYVYYSAGWCSPFPV